MALAFALVYRCGSEESDLLVVAFFGILVVSVIHSVPTQEPAWKIELDAASFLATTPNGRNFNLHASFIGRKEDAVIFYQVLQSARTD